MACGDNDISRSLLFSAPSNPGKPVYSFLGDRLYSNHMTNPSKMGTPESKARSNFAPGLGEDPLVGTIDGKEVSFKLGIPGTKMEGHVLLADGVKTADEFDGGKENYLKGHNHYGDGTGKNDNAAPGRDHYTGPDA